MLSRYFILFMIGWLMFPLYVFAGDQEALSDTNDRAFSFRISGFVKSDYWVDSRSVVAAREDLFLLYPAPIVPDADGKDLHGDPIYNFSAITSRILTRIDGPDAFGARVSGLIEADFSGVTNADINGFRLRHAYMKLEWERWGLLLGQWWHPMFTPEVFPTVVSLNTGAPFQPFIRNPQATLSYSNNQSRWMLSMIAQRDNASDGPKDATPEYIRNANMPNLHLQWMRASEHFTTGLAVDYKAIRPRNFIMNDDTGGLHYTSETLGSYAFMAFAGYRQNLFQLKGKAIYGQNLSEHLMMGGYAESVIDNDGGMIEYTSLNHLSVWGNILYGDQVQGGFFVGYGKNFGASDPVVGAYYGRGHDIDYLYRLAPSIVFNSGNLSFCTEVEFTAAGYGVPDHKGRVLNAREVNNLRLLFTALYFF